MIRRLLTAVVLAAGLALPFLPATTSTATAATRVPHSSPYGCWGWAPYRTVCYQIVGPGGTFLWDFFTQVQNGGGEPMPAAVRVAGPGGQWNRSIVIPPHTAWTAVIYINANVRPGVYCATFYSFGLTNAVHCWRVDAE